MRFGLLEYPEHANIGDAIQSLAARRFLPRVDCRVPRERLSEAPPPGAGPVGLICNGWFMHDPRFWPPHPDYAPLLLSMHFAETDFGRFQRLRPRPYERMLAGAGGDYLRQRGPVGARDCFTADLLARYDIPSYLSGCLTLTLSAEAERTRRSDAVVACDLSPAVFAHLRRHLPHEPVLATHSGAACRTTAEQDAAAARLLALYAGARAVVTTRLHAALPCLALGTPVLLIHDAVHGSRIDGPADLLRTCLPYDFLRDRHDFDFAAPPPNPEAFRPLAANLTATCQGWAARG